MTASVTSTNKDLITGGIKVTSQGLQSHEQKVADGNHNMMNIQSNEHIEFDTTKISKFPGKRSLGSKKNTSAAVSSLDWNIQSQKSNS